MPCPDHLAKEMPIDAQSVNESHISLNHKTLAYPVTVAHRPIGL